MRESWTDERLDDFAKRVDQRFDQVDKRFDKFERDVDRRFDKVDVELHRVNDRLDRMERLMAQGFIAMTTAIVAGFGGMAGLIASQL